MANREELAQKIWNDWQKGLEYQKKLHLKETCEQCVDFFEGNTQKAMEMQLKLYPLIKALFCEVNPIPAKTAASLMGFGECNLRLPLCDMSEKNLEYLKEEMRNFGIKF